MFTQDIVTNVGFFDQYEPYIVGTAIIVYKNTIIIALGFLSVLESLTISIFYPNPSYFIGYICSLCVSAFVCLAICVGIVIQEVR